jgi:hypothetical protein
MTFIISKYSTYSIFVCYSPFRLKFAKSPYGNFLSKMTTKILSYKNTYKNVVRGALRFNAADRDRYRNVIDVAEKRGSP